MEVGCVAVPEDLHKKFQTTENNPKQLCSGFPLKVIFAGFGGCEVVSIESLNEIHPSEDGRGVRRGDHLLPHKYIKNISTCGKTPTEHLLNTGRRPQTSQKAKKSPRTWLCGSQGLVLWPGVRPEPLRWEG